VASSGGEKEGRRNLHQQEALPRCLRFANGPQEAGVAKGTGSLYMPLVPEQVIAMLACARIGAVPAWYWRVWSKGTKAQQDAECQERHHSRRNPHRREKP
jgi:acetyl-CoA synthetase